MIKIGVLGAGHLGKIHIKLLKEIDGFELVGFYDPDSSNAATIRNTFNIQSFDNPAELIAACDAVDIVTPTLSHFDCAMASLDAGKHVFIEKPLTNTVEEAALLLEKAESTKLTTQVGHVERFNPAYLSLKNLNIQPRFIEAHRLSPFNPRGTDVSVILDLMIHDLDIVLNMVKSPVKKVHASGVTVLSSNPDIANARVEFENGCVANITASRISLKKMRKMRIFQQDAYISVDFLDKQSQVFRLAEHEPPSDGISVPLDMGKDGVAKFINFHHPKVEEVNAIKMELELFAESIKNESPSAVTIRDGYNAIKLAHQIYEKVKNQRQAASE